MRLADLNLKEIIKKYIVSLKLLLSKYPALKELVLKVLSINPKLSQRLKNLKVETPVVKKEYRQLSQRGKLIYKQLKNPKKKQEIM